MKSLFTSALLISALAGGTAFAATTKTPATAQGHQVAQATTTAPASKDAKKETTKKKAAASTKKAKPAAADGAPKTP